MVIWLPDKTYELFSNNNIDDLVDFVGRMLGNDVRDCLKGYVDDYQKEIDYINSCNEDNERDVDDLRGQINDTRHEIEEVIEILENPEIHIGKIISKLNYIKNGLY